MVPAAFALLLGTAVLWVAGEQFVIGSTRTAERSGLPMILVGVVVAGFGTSAPELAVSLLATTRGETDLALGNALGSNVTNVLLVLPLAALAAPWISRAELPKRELLAVGVASALVVAVAADGSVGRGEAAILLLAFAVSMTAIARAALRSPGRRELEAEIEELVDPLAVRKPVVRELARTVLALGFVLAAADRLVWGASRIARDFGISEAAIGLTIVALGTSLPEVATSVIAARRGEPDLVLGNVLGSNLFNALLIIGIGAAVRPLHIGGAPRAIGLIALAATALLLLPFARPGFRLTRRTAVAGLVGYACFIASLYASAA